MVPGPRQDWTFAEVLDWHLTHGTRPSRPPHAPGRPWSIKEFAASKHPTGIEYLRHKHQSQLYPSVVYKYEATRAAVEAVGAGGIMDPTPYRDHQIESRQLYFGVAVPPGSNEVIHRHDAPEIYVQIAGFARVWTKWYFADEWFERDLAPGDALLCQPGVCHFYQWFSPIGQGLAMVFKAPARGGVGRGTGKITCENGCPLFGDRCAGPASLPRRR
jgi:hypothetical protein